MKVIRKNCFETNSSSQHSIVVTKRDIHVTTEELSDHDYSNPEWVYLNKNGAMDMWGIDDGYGRSPFEVLSTFSDKLKYALCEFLGCKHADDPEYNEIFDEFHGIVKEVLPEFSHFDIKTREEDVWLDQDGNVVPYKSLTYEGWDREKKRAIYSYKDENGEKHEAIFDEENCIEEPDIGMIDHQSAGILKNFLKSHNISLKEFITNKRYVIIVDGDEICEWGEIVHSGLIDLDAIVEQYAVSDETASYLKWKEEHPDESDS